MYEEMNWILVGDGAIHMKSEESCMIIVSGKTTPEESQAKSNSLWGMVTLTSLRHDLD